MTAVRVVLTTVSGQEAAERLARTLVEERLIACANLVPGVVSVFRWKDQVQTEPEVLLLLKTREAVLDRLVQRLGDLHPYEVPEIVCLPPAAATAPYGQWVLAETGS